MKHKNSFFLSFVGLTNKHMQIGSVGTFLILAFSLCSKAQSLDPTFGSNGLITLASENRVEQFFSLTVQKDGRIVTVGSSKRSSRWDYLIQRHMQNGDLDKSFNNNGKLTLVADTIGTFNKVAIQNDGKIVVSGYLVNNGDLFYGGNRKYILMRFLPRGVLDPSFGNQGKVIVDFGPGTTEIKVLALQKDGKILIAGSYGILPARDVTLARYNGDGTLDITFGLKGITIISVSSGGDWANALLIQTDDKILVTGGMGNIILLRFNTNGSLDKTFAYNGIASTDIGSGSEGTSLALQKDNKIIVGGTSRNTHINATNGDKTYDSDFSLARFNANGILDSSFDSDGKVMPYDFFASTGNLYSVMLQSDGKIIAGGLSYGASRGYNSVLVIIRFNVDGSIDSAFGKNGFYVLSPCHAYGLQRQIDGKIIIGGNGNIFSQPKNYISLMRLTTGDTSTSIYPVNSINKILIYPNPANGFVTVELDIDINKPVNLDIIDMIGKVVKSYNQLDPVSINMIDLSEFVNGVYCFKFYTDNTCLRRGKIILSR